MFQRDACRGIWVPLATPFVADRLRPDALAPMVDWLLERGIAGFLALGTTGEAPHCSDDESVAVVDAVVRAARGRAPVFAGSGRPATAAAIDWARRMAGVGADAVLALTPNAYRGRMDGAALVRHYRGLADASPLPVFVYHMPDMSGVDLPADALVEILAHGNIWGFKDSSAQGGPLAAVLARVSTRGFVGSAARVVEALDAGACGAILAAAHAAPEACVALEAAWRANDRARAGALQELLSGLAAAWKGWAVPGVKYAAEARGLPAGQPRAPLAACPPEVRSRIDAALAALRHTWG
jgi:dihydrodipicolinate synthase/N-acetylneuraminate lyase